MEMAHLKNLYISRMLMSANLSNYQRDPEGMSWNGDIPRFQIISHSKVSPDIPMTSPWHPHGFRSPSGPEATQQEAGHTAQDTGGRDAVLRGHLAMAQKKWSGAHKIHLINGVDTG